MIKKKLLLVLFIIFLAVIAVSIVDYNTISRNKELQYYQIIYITHIKDMVEDWKSNGAIKASANLNSDLFTVVGNDIVYKKSIVISINNTPNVVMKDTKKNILYSVGDQGVFELK